MKQFLRDGKTYWGGSHPPASVWLLRTSHRALRCGETPPLPEGAQGGSGAAPRSRQGGEAALYHQERQRPQRPQGGRGERSRAGHATPAVPRTGATAGEAAMAPGVPGEAWRETGARPRLVRDWPDAPVRCPHAVWASWETPGTACPPAGALPPPAPAGECAW